MDIDQAKKKVEKADKGANILANVVDIGEKIITVGGGLWGITQFFRGQRDKPGNPVKEGEAGGKKKASDEKWYGFTLRHADPEKRKVWVDTIMPELHADYGEGFFARWGHNDLTNDVRVILEAMAQDEWPKKKVQKKNDKGKVTETIEEPKPGHKPLSSWCIEYFVDVYQDEVSAQQEAGSEDPHGIAIMKVKLLMRDAGFPVGRNAGIYNSADDFLARIPKSPKDFRSAVETAVLKIDNGLIKLRKSIHEGSERYKQNHAELPRWRRFLRS
jgi:hypothetical protein